MRTIEAIYEELLEAYSRRCGFRPEESCDLSVRLYAAAAQVQALEIQGEWVLAQSFPQTAQGEYLDYHADARGLKRLEGTKAKGVLRFSVGSPAAAALTISVRTVCTTEDGAAFQTTEEVILPVGAMEVDAEAEAVEPGRSGNAASRTITVMTACPVGVTACTNPAAFSGGSDGEDDETLRERVLESYRRLPNGANAAWYEQTAMSHEGVAEAQAVGRARGIGTVDVYIAAEDGAPEGVLLEAVRADLQERREIAVDVRVLAPVEESVNVAAAVAVEDGYGFEEVRVRVEQALAAFFNGRLLGKGVRVAELSSIIFRLEGVQNVKLSGPAADISPRQGVLPKAGSVSITEMEA